MWISAFVASASAYTLTGWDWTWQQSPIEDPFTLNAASFPFSNEADLEDVYATALWVWDAEGEAGLYVTYGGLTSNTAYGSDDGNYVTMYHGSTGDYAVARATQIAWNGGETTDCDIRVYGQNLDGPIDWHVGQAAAPPSELDLMATLIHELGHCWGLDHSEYDDAVMAPANSTGTGWEKRHLHSDDIDALQYVYGATSVDLVVGKMTWEDETGGDADGLAEPGEKLQVSVVVRNDGTGRAYEVVGVAAVADERVKVKVDTAQLGDVDPGAKEGTIADALVFQVNVKDECADDATVELDVDVEDWAGHTATKTFELALSCAPVEVEEPEDTDAVEEAAEEERARLCGCATTRPSAFAWGGVVLLWARRREKAERAGPGLGGRR